MTNKICDGCETVAHCLKNGCVPKTSKQTEALKLALEALLSWGKGFPDNWGDLDAEAVTAIREALAEESSGTEQPAHSEAYWQNKITIAYAEGWLKGQVRVKQQPAQHDWNSDFHLRGILANELKCWHRLTEDEAKNLLKFCTQLVIQSHQDWKLVPVKPTRDMSDAGGSAVRVCYSNRKGDRKEGEMMCDYIYRKMLNAAPQKEQDK